MYKRQPLALISCVVPQAFWKIWSCQSVLYKTWFPEASLIPVSYTHLDVYKRQAVTLSNFTKDASSKYKSDANCTVPGEFTNPVWS